MSTVPPGSTNDPRQLLASVAQGALAQNQLQLPSRRVPVDTLAQAPAETTPETENNGGFYSFMPACITDAFASFCNCLTSIFQWITSCFASANINEEPTQRATPDAPPSSPSTTQVADAQVTDDRLAVTA